MPCRPTVLATHAAALAAIMLLVGCAGAPPAAPQRGAASEARPGLQQVSYEPPEPPARSISGLAVSQPWWEVEQRLSANVLAIPDAELAPGRSGAVFVVRYSGDPRDYINCGKINLQDKAGGGAKQVDATSDKVQLPRTSRHPKGRLERKMRLDSRSTLHLTELPGGGTLIDDSTRYVVTKEIHTWAFGGGETGQDKWQGATRETIAFNTGESGTFGAGTVCVATGRLEEALLQGLATTTAPAVVTPVAVEPPPTPPAPAPTLAPAAIPEPTPAPEPAALPAPGGSTPGLF